MAERRQVIVDLVTRTQGGTRGIKNLKQNLGGVNQQAGKASKSVKGLGKSSAGATKGMRGLAGGMGAGSLAMGGVAAAGLAVGAVLKGSISAFAEFDDKMKSSQAIMGELSDDAMQGMEDAARDVAKTTRLSAADAAESYFFLASAGLDAEASIAALPKVAAFAQAGMFDMATATDLLTDAQSALGLTSDDATVNMQNMVKVSDIFVKSNQLANTSVQQVSEAITNKLGGSLRAAGIDLEEGVAVLAAFADQGLKGASAGEAMNIALRDLSKAARNNEAAFKKAGIEVFDQQGNFMNMADIIEDLEGSFVGLSAQKQADLAADLGFQDRSFKNIQLLLGTSDAVREYEKQLRSAGGATQEVADNQLLSFSAQMDLMKSRVVDAGISLGEALAPVVLEVAGGFLTMLEAIMPLISAGAKLFAVLFKFSGLNFMFKFLGAAGDGFQRLSGLWDEGARSATVYKDAIKNITKAVEDGDDPTVALANAMAHLSTNGELTAESIAALGAETGITAEMMQGALKANLEWSRAQGDMGVEVAALEVALLSQIDAMSITTEEADALKSELGLVHRVAKRARGSAEELTDADGNLINAQGELIDSTGNLIDAEGNLIDANGDLIEEVLTLNDALLAAEDAQTSLSDAMRAQADPLFAAAKAMVDLQAAELALIEVQEDHHSTASELAQAELDLLDATLMAQGGLDALDAAGLEDQITIVQDVLGKSREEALLFLEALGLLDGKEIGVGVNTVFTASGSREARAAASSGGTSAFLMANSGGGQRRHGGRTEANKPVLVGEAGPEIFMPQVGGMVVPNDQLMSAGGSSTETNTTINFVNPNLANDPVKAIRSRFAFDALAGRA